MGLHVALLTQANSPLGERKEGAVVAWFGVASQPCAAGRRWQSISQLSVRSRPPRPCVLSAVLGTSRLVRRASPRRTEEKPSRRRKFDSGSWTGIGSGRGWEVG